MNLSSIDLLAEDIWLTPNDKTELAKKIIDSNTTDFFASLSPDGKKVAFVSTSRGYPQLFLHNIETGKQRLLFANPKQLLFIAYPIWHQSSNKLASALNQRPFIIDLAEDNHKTTELSYAKGVPEQWFYNEESLLIVNYHQGKKAYVKLSLKNKSMATLLSSVEHHALLSNHNDLLLLSNNTIIQANFNGNQPEAIASLDGEIIAHFPTAKGIYLKVKKQGKYSLWLYTYKNSEVSKESKLAGDVNIWDIEQNNNFMLTSSLRSEKDLLLLTLKGDN